MTTWSQMWSGLVKPGVLQALGSDGHLHAPELAVEVLSPGSANERRDREVKLKLYSRRGVLEYWIVDWRTQQVEVYRQQNGMLCQVGTLSASETLTLAGCSLGLRAQWPSCLRQHRSDIF